MAIAFRSSTSTSFASRTNTVLTAPAGIADGDILICILVTAANPAAPTPTPPAGFASFGTATSVVDPSGFNGKLWIYWKRASSESGSYTFSHTTASSQGLLKAYSGCLASGTPLGATSNNTGAGTADSVGTSITTTAANSYLLFEEHDWEGTTTLTPPSGMTERFDSLVYSADQLIASAGSTGSRTMTNGNGTVTADRWAVRMVELLVATAGGSTYNDTTAETAAAAETAGGLLTTTKAVAETAAAAETAGGLLVTAKAVAESASAADTVAGLLAFTGAVVEVANAEDTHFAFVIPAGGTLYEETVLETLAANDTVAADVIPGEVTPEAPLGGPGPAGEGVRRRFELYLLPEEDEEKPRRKRRLRLKKAELEDKIEAAVEYIEAGSPRPMAPQAMVAEVSTLMGLDALLEVDRRRVERTIYQYLAAMLEEEEEEGMAMMLLAA